MQFTQIPKQYAPIEGRLVYAFTAEPSEAVDIEIVDCRNNKVLGTKRFVGVREASFDIAPYLRGAVDIQPDNVPTGFGDASGRSVRVALRSDDDATPERTFIPSDTYAAAPAVLTSMPQNRLISHGEYEEITVLTDVCECSLHAFSDSYDRHMDFANSEVGVNVFKLDTKDFPEADTIVLDFGDSRVITYTVTKAIKRVRRIAWRSSKGSIEHYTFPIVKSTEVTAAKQRARSQSGVVVAAVDSQWHTTLCSAYETRSMLGVLAEILTSPDVWVIENGEYIRVDVATPSAATHRHGSVGMLEIEIVQKTKPAEDEADN